MSGRAKSGIKATDAKGAPRSAAAQGIESAAALAATTGVFLAGAVSGAVAKVVDDRARSDAAQVQPADPADEQSQPSHAAAPQSPEPNDQSDTVAAIATADTAGGVSSAAETFAADPAARGADPAALRPHADAREEPAQDIERGGPPSASHTVSTTTDTADVDVAHHDEAVSQPVVPEEQQDTSHNAPPANQPLIEAIAGSATPDLGEAFQKLTTLVEALETKQAQLTERLDQTVCTLGDAIEARVDTVLSEATTKLDTALERLDGSLETTLAKVTDIPQSLLGAGHDAGSGGGAARHLVRRRRRSDRPGDGETGGRCADQRHRGPEHRPSGSLLHHRRREDLFFRTILQRCGGRFRHAGRRARQSAARAPLGSFSRVRYRTLLC